MLTVSLQGLRFQGFHGIYPEEKLLGNEFEVAVSVGFEAPGEISTIGNTVDYEWLYTLVKKEMTTSRDLLEEVAAAIVAGVKNRYPFIKTITVTVKKLHPPVAGEAACSAVSLHEEF